MRPTLPDRGTHWRAQARSIDLAPPPRAIASPVDYFDRVAPWAPSTDHAAVRPSWHVAIAYLVRCGEFNVSPHFVRTVEEIRTMSTKRHAQISVPLDENLRAFLERLAAREDRTLAGQIRHLVAEAARQQIQKTDQAA